MGRRAALAALWCATLAAATSPSNTGTSVDPQPRDAAPATLVLRGGHVATLERDRPEAEAIAVTGDTIAAIGSDREIEPYVGPATR